MKNYDEDDDESSLDSLMDAMEGLDTKQFTSMKAPNGGTTVEVHIHPQGMGGEAPIEAGSLDDQGASDEAMLPTPEELEEMMKGLA